MGDERLSYEVLEAKYLACKGAKKWDHAEAHANLIRVHHPNRVDGWINQAESLCELRCGEGGGSSVIGRGTLQLC